MITKELFKEVSGVDNSVDFEFDGKYLRYGRVISDVISIHELAHKCKEWALKYDFQILSCTQNENSWAGAIDLTFDEYSDNEYETGFLADTEPEAIFKACRWILENSKNQ